MKAALWSLAVLIGMQLAACAGGGGSSRAPLSLDLTIAPISLNLGNETLGTTSTAQTVTLTNNSSSGSITVSNITVSGPFAFTGMTPPATLNPGQSLGVRVTFTPTASGATSGTLTVASTAGNSPATVALVGAGSSSSSSSTVNISPGTDIHSVVNANPAGTTFVISPGTYRLTQPITPKNNDTFIGQTTCAPPTSSCATVLSGSQLLTSFQFDGTNYYVTGQTQQGTVTHASTICETGWEACIYPEDLFFDGMPLQHLAGSSLPTIGVGQWWFDYTNHIIYFHDNPSGHTVETSVTPSAFTGTANNVTIQYLTIEEFAAPIQRGAIAINIHSATQATNWAVQDCEILLNHGFGVAVNYGLQVLNNYIHNNGNEGVGGGTNSGTVSSGITIAYNLVTANNYAHANPGFGAGGIKLGQTANAVVRGNTVRNNGGEGIHFDVSSVSPLIDGNTVTDNLGGDGIQFEIGLTSAIVRNNILKHNSAADAYGNPNGPNLSSVVSAGMEAYCNAIEVAPDGEAAMWFNAANRGTNPVPPGAGQLYASTGNYFHHNTVIWDSASHPGPVGGLQFDTTYEPQFFTVNPGFDYNTYHLPSLNMTPFHWSVNNTPWTFAQFQAAGQDVHGSVDTNTTSGFPTVTITSPADQSTVSGTATITAMASDTSGISDVEFYVDWVLQSTVTSSPYNFNWTGGATGSHTVTAMAHSNAGIRTCFAVTLNVP